MQLCVVQRPGYRCNGKYEHSGNLHGNGNRIEWMYRNGNNRGNSKPSVTITGADKITCTQTTVTRTASVGVNYLWSNGLVNNATAIITAPGNYSVTVIGADGCSTIETVAIADDCI